MNKTISVRSALSVSSVSNDMEDYTSEEDNPNDRSGLLSFARGNKRSRRKGQITKKKNKWISKKDTQSIGRKSFRDNASLSLILPRYKNKMKRNRMIRKKKPNQQIIMSSGSPYEEYLPARFRDYKNDELNNSKLSNKKFRKELKQIDLPSAYVLSPSVPLSSKPPMSRQSMNRELNFYNQKEKKSHRRDGTGQSTTSLIKRPKNAIEFDLEELDEENYDNTSSSHNLDEMNHDNVMFQRNHKVKPHPEDKANHLNRDMSAGIFKMFDSNKAFTDKGDAIHHDSRNQSKDGSRTGSKGRTYTSEKAVFSSIKLQ
jgi:hypothetical protein